MLACKAKPTNSAGAGGLQRGIGRADFFPLRVLYPSHPRLRLRAQKYRQAFGGGIRLCTRSCKLREEGCARTRGVSSWAKPEREINDRETHCYQEALD